MAESELLAAFYFLLEVQAEMSSCDTGEAGPPMKGLETLQRAAEGDFERGERQRLMKELRGADRKDYRATTGSREAVPSRARGGGRGRGGARGGYQASGGGRGGFRGGYQRDGVPRPPRRPRAIEEDSDEDLYL